MLYHVVLVGLKSCFFFVSSPIGFCLSAATDRDPLIVIRVPSHPANLKRQRSGSEVSGGEILSRAQHKRKTPGFLRPTASFLLSGSKGSSEQKQPQKSAIRLKESPCLLINVYLHDNKRKMIRPQRHSYFQGDGVFDIHDFPGSFFFSVSSGLSLRPAVWIVLNVLSLAR